ncbi:MAG: hypothetical protein PHR77_07130, partial [Kiritimatiellae bacterium]|nr:hypothetical protein [Kiritimatiellia bacterium]
ASIIAREGFLRALKEMEKNYKIEFHKGASPAEFRPGSNSGKNMGRKYCSKLQNVISKQQIPY